ncbi:MAG: tRNA (N6-isopentenyl adenosine(37)-C2)-methylthiotransferase MiaB [Candidatus Falkowbacteria bacterium]
MKKYHIITIGCQMNKSDSERIASYLEDLGLILAQERPKADLVIITTCGVRASAENRIFGLIPRIRKENPAVKIVLTGCLSEREDIKKRTGNTVDAWMSIGDFSVINNLLSDQCQLADIKYQSGLKSGEYLNIEPKYSSGYSAYIPIGNGCDNYCAYCVVPYARGREVYRPADDILREVGDLIKRGYKEINLIAQNVNSYKYPISLPCRQAGNIQHPINDQLSNNQKLITFPLLLKSINDLDGDFWIRFSSNHPKDMNDELINILPQLNKVCEHIHLPAQAGDNDVLKAMNRHYTVEHYENLIKKIRQAVPGAAITTDIIVGFPGETREQFENTLKLFKEVKFDMAYIAQYSPRPGTAAAKLVDDVTQEEKKKREEELTAILRETALENNKKYLNQVVDVLVEGKNRKGKWFGRTRTEKNVEIGNWKLETGNLEGKFIKVRITEAKDFGMKGEFIK